MDYSKWIEELLKTTGKYIKNHKDQIITGTTAAVGTGIITSMFWVSHEENAKIEADKEGYVRASKVYEKKCKELKEYISKLERQIKQPDKETERFIDDILDEYELSIRKILQMYKNELIELEKNKNKSQEEIDYMIQMANDYADYKLKLFGGEATSDIYFMVGNIAYLDVDCIVNAANKSLRGGGGVDGAIHKAAGKDLLQECKTLHGCNVGEAKITNGYNLSAQHVIHTVGPRYKGKKQDEIDLANCYVNSLNLAKENGIHTIAFPAISTGTYGYPLKEASEIALGTVSKWLVENADYPIAVIMCSYDAKTYEVYRNIWTEVEPTEVIADIKGSKVQSKQEKDGKFDISKFKGLGFGIIYKACDIVMDGSKGYLVWDYIVYNEISFVNEKTRETKSLYQSISDSKTEKEFERLLKKYS